MEKQTTICTCLIEFNHSSSVLRIENKLLMSPFVAFIKQCEEIYEKGGSQ